MNIGIDVGGTKIAIGTSDIHDQLIVFPVTQDFNTDLGHIFEAVQSISNHPDKPISGIGLAIPGLFNASRDDLVTTANIPHWAGQGIVRRLSDKFNVTVVLGNDLEAQALGEAYQGHGQGRNFLQIGWGTGIGSAFVRLIDGKPRVLPGEIGHTQVKASGDITCTCGQLDCLECYAGGAGLEKRYGVPATELSPQQWEEAAGWMAYAIKNAVTALPVELVVFSGGIAQKQPQLLSQIEERLRQSMKVIPAPALKLTALGDRAGVLGATTLLH